MHMLSALMHEIGHLLGYEHTEDGLMSPVFSAGSSRAEAVEPLGRAEWRSGCASDLGRDGDEELTRVPHRSRIQQYERDLDDWFAELAAAE